MIIDKKPRSFLTIFAVFLLLAPNFADAQPAGNRRLSGAVVVSGKNDEIGDDIYLVPKNYPVQMTLGVEQPAAVGGIPYVRWGGECRVEVDLVATALSDGTVRVTGQVRLYEGTSEDSQDLEDAQPVNLLVLKGGVPSTTNIHVESRGFGGGDFADVQIVFTNSLVE